jgi:hypothetical protein
MFRYISDNKRFLIVSLILINSFSSVYNQVIKGTILDGSTKVPIDYALVYFNGTFVGTNTDKNGYFELDISNNLSMPLTVSALGYQSVMLNDFKNSIPFQIFLTPKVFELKEVIITGKADLQKRKANLDFFRREFLGRTANASKCEIVNEEDILFSYDAKSDVMTASSSKPILINNKALGYTVYYYLDKFESCKKNNYILIIGNYIFKEHLSADSIQRHRYEVKRKTTYLGSRMQFFRSLWEDRLDSMGFMIKDSLNKKVTYNNIVVQADNPGDQGQLKYLKGKGTLKVTYYTRWQETRIKITKEKVLFDKRGFFDPMGILWDGEMMKQRIADLLPFEYSIKE